MKGTTWYIRRYVCDNGIEYKTKFPVREDLSCMKSSRKKSQAVARAEKGAKEASHEMGRLMNCNFRVGHDFYMGIDYSDKGMSKLEDRAKEDDTELIIAAKKEYENFMRRVKRKADKLGIEVKAIAVISVSDPKTGEPTRIHHHLVVNAEAVEILESCWTSGGVWSKKLYSNFGVDLQELADYMIAQAARVGVDKRYTHTRNLARAIVSKPVKARKPEAELSVPQGCEKIWRSEYKKGRAQHIRYYRPPTAPPEDSEDA